jgi:hypothetical protein
MPYAEPREEGKLVVRNRRSDQQALKDRRLTDSGPDPREVVEDDRRKRRVLGPELWKKEAMEVIRARSP